MQPLQCVRFVLPQYLGSQARSPVVLYKPSNNRTGTPLETNLFRDDRFVVARST
jgi:hypothetical protein